jgi:hypothetical protein
LAARENRFSNARQELSSFHKFSSSSNIKPKANGTTCVEMQETSFTTNYEPEESRKVEDRQDESITDASQERNNNIEDVERSDSIGDRLSNIETRLTELERSLTNNFNQIINHIQRKKQ